MKNLKCKCGDDTTYENLEKMYRNFQDSIYNYVSSNIKKKHLPAIYAHLGIKFNDVSSVIRFCGDDSIANGYEVAWVISREVGK